LLVPFREVNGDETAGETLPPFLTDLNPLLPADEHADDAGLRMGVVVRRPR
jgi:hypothetical protein